MYYFISDEHFGHKNIIKFCNRPFNDVYEMNEKLIENHNSIITEKDTVVHAGDFSLGSKSFTREIIERLNGHHIFLKGSHDKWLDSERSIFEYNYNGYHIVACHYQFMVWPLSHYNSINVFGHTHREVNTIGRQFNICVDVNNFKPISVETIIEHVKHINNPDLVQQRYNDPTRATKISTY